MVGSVAALLDDPGQSDIDIDYVLPFLNLRWSNIVVNMVMLGLQYSEEVAEITVPAGTATLSDFMATGEPLNSLMKPKSIDWKPVGAPDTQYVPSNQVNELDDVDGSSQGLIEYSWQGGTVQVTPSAIDVIARVRFLAMSTQLVDPTDEMVKGIGDIVAYRVGEIIAGVRGNASLKVDCRLWGDEALDDFLAMSNLQSQAVLTKIPATHQRGRFPRFVARA